MDCPKCPGKLKEIDLFGVKIDACWICEGLWFDEAELEKVLANDQASVHVNTLATDEFDGKEISVIAKEVNEKEGHCPVCETKPVLKKVQSGDKSQITIDECSTCKGIWLDGGEIHWLRDETLRKKTNKKEAISAYFSALATKINLLFLRRQR